LHFSSVTRFGTHCKLNKRLPRDVYCTHEPNNITRLVAHYEPNERKARYNAVTWISAS